MTSTLHKHVLNHSYLFAAFLCIFAFRRLLLVVTVAAMMIVTVMVVVVVMMMMIALHAEPTFTFQFSEIWVWKSKYRQQ